MAILLLNVVSKGVYIMKIAKLFTLIFLLVPGLVQASALSDAQKKELTPVSYTHLTLPTTPYV